MSNLTQPVILFDGVCNLCHAAVQWVIDRDPKGVFRFASLQSEAAREVLQGVGELPDSVVLVDKEGVHTRSEAAVRIAARLGWPYRIAVLGRVMPGLLRDAVYGWIARNRYGWFGRSESCRVPTAELAGRFLDADESIAVPERKEEVRARVGWWTRFLWAYTLLYLFPLPAVIGHKFYPWLALQTLGVSIKYFPAGSGDTTYNYVEVAFTLLMALVVSLAWRWGLPYWTGAVVHLLIRYRLGLTMLGYGWAKLIPMQFGHPGPANLLRSYADSSPMGLVWTMIAASTPYQMFLGAVEVLVGLLLLFPATALVGAFGAAAASIQIMALNYCYDIPVKLSSTHLFFLSCLLIFPQLPRLFSFFVLRIPTVPPPDMRLRLAGKWWPRLALALKCFILGSVMVAGPIYSYRFWKAERAVVEASPFHGFYSVDPYEGKPNLKRWVRVGITGDRMMAVVLETGELIRFGLRHDAKAGTLELKPFGSALPEVYKYTHPSAGTLQLEIGEFKVILRQDAKSKSLLLTRGFHWINELPFNR
ncbi:MAG: thiol-disulfide oxidoreductase DCC family protein [Acidobacteria bacterium]|nr:thiol-disulfide oxidoreductase DCC family protein [Acidobacteriota bacterium]